MPDYLKRGEKGKLEGKRGCMKMMSVRALRGLSVITQLCFVVMQRAVFSTCVHPARFCSSFFGFQTERLFRETVIGGQEEAKQQPACLSPRPAVVRTKRNNKEWKCPRSSALCCVICPKRLFFFQATNSRWFPLVQKNSDSCRPNDSHKGP